MRTSEVEVQEGEKNAWKEAIIVEMLNSSIFTTMEHELEFESLQKKERLPCIIEILYGCYFEVDGKKGLFPGLYDNLMELQ